MFDRKPHPQRHRFHPDLEGVEARTTPAVANIPNTAVAVVPDDGGIPRVFVVDAATGATVGDVVAYENAFRGGVRAALGDVTGDGVKDLVIAPAGAAGPASGSSTGRPGTP